MNILLVTLCKGFSVPDILSLGARVDSSASLNTELSCACMHKPGLLGSLLLFTSTNEAFAHCRLMFSAFGQSVLRCSQPLPPIASSS